MLISVLLIFSSPSFDTDVSRRCRFFLMTSSSETLLVSFTVDDVAGFWLEPRDPLVDVSLTSFEGVEEREVEASSRLDSL